MKAEFKPVLLDGAELARVIYAAVVEQVGTPAEIAAPKDSNFVLVPRIAIAAVGEQWPCSTGPWTVTREDLVAAVAALDDPAIKSPRLKVGHTSKLGDGEPALGVLQNLTIGDGGMTLYADAVVPKWLADIWPVAFPNRSVEARLDVKTATGREHALVIDRLALLGVVLPGISILDDMQPIWGETMPEGTTVAASIAASVSIDEVRRAFYDKVATGDRTWWWIREIELSPTMQAIVDDDDNGYYRVPFSFANNEVTFEDPIPVEIQYVDQAVAAKQVGGPQPAARYHKRDASIPKGESMDVDQLRKAMNLADDVSDDEVVAQAAAKFVADATKPKEEPKPEGEPAHGEPPTTPPGVEGEPKPTPTPEPAPTGTPPQVPEGTVLVEAGAWQATQAGLGEFQAWQRKQLQEERDREIKAAIDDGRIAPASADKFKALYDKDKAGTQAVLASLTPNRIPVRQMSAAGATDLTRDGEDDYPSNMLKPGERERIETLKAGNAPDNGGRLVRMSSEVM